LTRTYDRALEPVALTISQFALLIYLYQGHKNGRGSACRPALAAFLGVRRTALDRDLKLLEADGLITSAIDQIDRRVRAFLITPNGEEKLHAALPCWHAAQNQIRKVIGVEVASQLNSLLDLTIAKLTT
jgi:DNA-binding MarR family transcriptional regulator